VNRAQLAAAAFAIASVAARSALGADDTATSAAMREHFAAGVRLYDAKDYEHALTEFETAYKANAVPAIERNIALTLEHLGRYPEALDALERFVTDSGTALAPAVRTASEAKESELRARVATVHVRVTPDGAPVSVDGSVLASDRADPAVHLAPGEHVFAARAEGFVAGEVHRVLSAGEEATVAIELAPATAAVAAPSSVSVGPSIADATPAAAPDQALPPPPPRYEAARAPAERARRSFVELSLGLGAEALRLSPQPFVGDPNAAAGRETWGTLGLSIAGGKDLSPTVSMLGYGEIAGGGSPYSIGGSTWTVGITDLVLAPGVRLHTRGSRIRFYGDIAGGLDVRWVDAHEQDGGVRHVTGSGTGLAMLAGVGLEVHLPAVYLSGGLGMMLHGIGSVRSNDGPLFADGSAGRVSARVAVGYPF
jgi:hypothetical protein